MEKLDEQVKTQLIPTVSYCAHVCGKRAYVSWWYDSCKNADVLKEFVELSNYVFKISCADVRFETDFEVREDTFWEMINNDQFRNELNIGWYRGTEDFEITDIPSLDKLVKGKGTTGDEESFAEYIENIFDHEE